MTAELPKININLFQGEKSLLLHEKVKQPLDKEWVELMKEAFALGLSVEEIRSFLEQSGS